MMRETAYIVLGSTGLIGSAVQAFLERQGVPVIAVHSKNYREWVGTKAKVLVNCNGNSFRFRANKDPVWDFEASVATVQRSLFDFHVEMYVYVSTVDVYPVLDDPSQNHEEAPIRPEGLMPYALHKWLAERLVRRYAPHSVILRLGTALGPGLKKNPIYDLLHGQPVFISLESELTLIDTQTAARCLPVILGTNPHHEIFNVTGTGSARLREVTDRVTVPARVAPDMEQATYRYHINTQKLSRLLPLPASSDVLSSYLASVGEACVA